MAEVVKARIMPVSSLGNKAVIAVWVSLGLQYFKTVLLLAQLIFLPQLAPISVAAVWVTAISYYAAGFIGIAWIQRCYNNLAASGSSGFKYMPTWIWWGWIIPVSNWIMPYKVVKELWEKSGSDDEPSALVQAPAQVRLKSWWAAWLVSGLVSILLSLGRTLQQPLISEIVLIVHAIAITLAAHYWTKIICDVNHRQLHKIPELRELAAGTVPEIR
jgi:hypothetical protein